MSLPPTEPSAPGHARGTMLMNWLRVCAFVGALIAGAFAFRDHAFPPWWRWIADLGVGWVLLVAALAERHEAEESPWRRRLRFAAGVVAVAAGAVALRTGPDPAHVVAAIVATVTTLSAFIVARWVPFSHQEIDELTGAGGDTAVAGSPRQLWRFALVGFAVAVSAIAIRWDGSNHLAAFLLWLASLALFAIAWWSEGAPGTPATAPWVATGGPPVSRTAEVMGLLWILTIAAMLRFVELDSVPHIIDLDDSLIGRHAENIWRHGFPDPFGVGWNTYSNLSFMVHYIPIQLFGMSHVNLRAASAALGLLSLIPMFFWVRRWWGNIVALLAVLILALNVEHIRFSRVGFNVIQILPVATLTLAAFARVLASGRRIDWVWLGYAMGLGFHTYHPAKNYPAWLAGAALLFAIGMPGFLRRYLTGALIGAGAYLMMTAPVIVSNYGHWSAWSADNSGRVDIQELTAAYHANDGIRMQQYLNGHFGDEVRRFIDEPAIVTLLSPAMSVPFLLGIGWLLWRWRDPRNLVSLVWLGGILFITAFTIEPRFQRLVGFLPIVALIPALVAGHARRLLHRCWPRHADVIVVPALLVWLSADSYHAWYAEFLYRGSLRHPTSGVCRIMQRVASPVTFYAAGVAGDESPDMAANICMIADDPERRIVNLSAEADIVPIPPAHRGTAVLLVFPPFEEVTELIHQYYPEVQPQTYLLDDNRVGITAFILPPAQISAHWGFRVSFQSETRSWVSPVPLNVIQVPSAATFPVRATARGLVWIARTGAYGFRGRGASSVAVDGQPLREGATVMLAHGWHGLMLETTLNRPPDHVLAEWQGPDQKDWEQIPVGFLHAYPEVHGLLGRYFSRQLPAAGATPIDSPPDASALATTLSFDWFVPNDAPPPPPFAARPSTMEWVGTVDLPDRQERGLRLFASTPTEVFIDGKRVLQTGESDGRDPVETTISGSGTLPILVRTVRRADDPHARWTLRLLWQAPGGSWNTFAAYQPAGM